MNEYTIHPMFYIPLFHTKIKGVEDNIKNEIYNPTSFNYLRLEDNSAWITDCSNVLDIPTLYPLKQKILNSIELYVRDVLCISNKLTYKITSSWCISHNKHDFSIKHYHNNSIISGIYYPMVNKDSGKIWFYRENKLFYPTVDLIVSEYNNNNCKSYFILPEIDSLILFPSQIYHSVDENKSDIDRFALAFNVFFEGNFTTTNNKIDYLSLSLN